MSAKRKQDNSPAACVMRKAVAYDRLAAKASRAGNRAEETHYNKKSLALKLQVDRMRAREAERAAGLRAWNERNAR